MNRFILIIFLFSFSQTGAQWYRTIENDFYKGLNDGKAILSFPSDNTTAFLESAGIALVSTGAAFLLDNEIQKAAIRNQTNTLSNIFKIDNYYGNIYSIGLAAGIYSAGLFSSNEYIRRAGLNSISALVYSGIITQVLKYSIGRYRPYKDKGNFSFNPFTINNDNFSLPSGHTTLAFAVSTALAESFDNDYLSVILYTAAGTTAAARIYHNQHWFSDTILAGLIGYGIGKFVVNHQANNNSLTFIATPYGISVVYSLN